MQHRPTVTYACIFLGAIFVVVGLWTSDYVLVLGGICWGLAHYLTMVLSEETPTGWWGVVALFVLAGGSLFHVDGLLYFTVFAFALAGIFAAILLMEKREARQAPPSP